jgi:hypothetical protein
MIGFRVLPASELPLLVVHPLLVPARLPALARPEAQRLAAAWRWAPFHGRGCN